MTMAKIHVRGGSPLRLEFEDDAGTTLEVELKEKGGGEYFVIDKATNDKLKTHRDAGKSMFRQTNPSTTSCEIGYMSKAKTKVTA
jgi:hypothetical protein